jgi:O-antigen/teichoic acid export membrane protein
MNLSRTAANFSHLLGSHAVGRLLAFLALPITLRLLVPEEYAKLSLFATITLMTGALLNWPTNAMGRFGREEFVRDATCRRTFWAVFWIRVPLRLLALAAIWVLQARILQFVQLPPMALWLLAAWVLLGGSSGLPELLQAQGRYGASAWILQLPALVNLAFVLLMAAAWLPVNVLTLALSFCIGSILLAGGFMLSVRHSVTPPVLERAWTGRILAFSWPFLIHGGAVYALDYIDTVTLRCYMPMAAVGIYAVAYNLNIYARSPIAMLSPLIQPHLVTAYLEGRMDRVSWFYRRIVPQVSLAVGQLAALLVLLLPAIALVVGPRFSKALPAFSLLVGGMGWQAMTVLMTPLFYASGRVGCHIAAYVAMALVNLAVDVALVPRIGLMGAAVGKIAADVTGMGIQGWFLRRFFNCSPLSGMVWSLPLWAVIATVLLGLPWGWTAAAWAAGALAVGWTGRRLGLFDDASAAFFGRLGLPPAVSRPALTFYRKWLVAPRAG